MNIQLRRGKSQQGSVLLIVVAICVILGLSVASYLTLINFQYRLAVASRAWNTALTISEAGIEDGLAQLNVNFGTNYSSSAQTNWSLTGTVYGPRTLTMSNGSFSAIILSSDPCPTIISTGYVSVPYTSQSMRRVVRATTTNIPAFLIGMAVQLDIDTKGQNLTVDSYDSTDPNHSTNGLYDASTRLAGGDVATMGGFVNVQNASIYGKLMTGPGASYTIGNGTVGDLNWNVKGQIQDGWYKNDFNMLFKDVTAPFTSGSSVTPVNSGTNTYVLAGGDYFVDSDFVLSQGETLYVAGNSRLYVTGNVTMKSQNECFITLAPGATLKLYVGTTDGAAVSAALTQVNNTGNASSFQYYGLPSNNKITWNGNNVYMGTVYAPQADLEAGGGGSTVMDYQGACTVNSVSLNGHFNFHYDENLRRSGPNSGFTITSWREL
jgi:Tfp pilus assembly protein PilX